MENQKERMKKKIDSRMRKIDVVLVNREQRKDDIKEIINQRDLV